MGGSIWKRSWTLFFSVYILFLPCCPLGLGGREGDGWLGMRINGELAAVNFSYVSFTGIYNLKIVVLWNAPICLGFNFLIMETPAGATEKQTQCQELHVSFNRIQSREFNASSTAPSLIAGHLWVAWGQGKKMCFKWDKYNQKWSLSGL